MSRPELSVKNNARRKSMDRSGSKTAHGVLCSSCQAEFDVHEIVNSKENSGHCSRCGTRLPADESERGCDRTSAGAPSRSPPLGGLVLVWRNWVLRCLSASTGSELSRGRWRYLAAAVLYRSHGVGSATKSMVGQMLSALWVGSGSRTRPTIPTAILARFWPGSMRRCFFRRLIKSAVAWASSHLRKFA